MNENNISILVGAWCGCLLQAVSERHGLVFDECEQARLVGRAMELVKDRELEIIEFAKSQEEVE